MTAVALPLGEAICYTWEHIRPRRPEAVLCLEQTAPFNINFIQLTSDGNVYSESGWHGSWTRDVCTRTRKIGRHGPWQHARDEIITLQGLRYKGLDADWTHYDFTLARKKADETDYYVCTGCGHCRKVHSVRMKLREGLSEYTASRTPHPPTMREFDMCM